MWYARNHIVVGFSAYGILRHRKALLRGLSPLASFLPKLQMGSDIVADTVHEVLCCISTGAFSYRNRNRSMYP